MGIADSAFTWDYLEGVGVKGDNRAVVDSDIEMGAEGGMGRVETSPACRASEEMMEKVRSRWSEYVFRS